MIEPWMIAVGCGIILSLTLLFIAKRRQASQKEEGTFDDRFKDWTKKVEEREPD